eukprot:Awhi_evm1s8144
MDILADPNIIVLDPTLKSKSGATKETVQPKETPASKGSLASRSSTFYVDIDDHKVKEQVETSSKPINNNVGADDRVGASQSFPSACSSENSRNVASSLNYSNSKKEKRISFGRKKRSQSLSMDNENDNKTHVKRGNGDHNKNDSDNNDNSVPSATFSNHDKRFSDLQHQSLDSIIHDINNLGGSEEKCEKKNGVVDSNYFDSVDIIQTNSADSFENGINNDDYVLKSAARIKPKRNMSFKLKMFGSSSSSVDDKLPKENTGIK